MAIEEIIFDGEGAPKSSSKSSRSSLPSKKKASSSSSSSDDEEHPRPKPQKNNKISTQSFKSSSRVVFINYDS